MSTSRAPLRVVIAEDSAILRDGLVQLLADRGFAITDAVADADALWRAIERERPDVAVVDIRMPPTFTDEGLLAAIELRRHYEGLGILLFSQYIETRYAAELLADDAAGIGYLLKDRVADVSDFVEALRLQDKLTPLHAAIFLEPGVCGVKYASTLIGRTRNEMRLPLVPIGEATEAVIRRAMVHAGVLNA